ncbi:MAG: tail fiber domain-containing protein [Flavobacteriaceae bacterium]|nr:tail fiber domain-containing protein [Flavobacteriaceae bacterium]
MKNYNYIFILFLSFFSVASYGQVGIGTTTPNPSAMLEIDNANKGVLIPRMALSDVTDTTAPINAPATSLIVYNTNATVTGGSGIGFYYFDGTQWISFSSASNSWALIGNSNTTPATNYIGTSDAQDFIIKTNNAEAIRVTSTGDVGIGTNAPSTKLHISTITSGATIFTDGFEDNTLAPFTTGGDVNWEVGTNPNTGSFAAQVPTSANNNDITYMEYVVTIPANGGKVSFSYSTSTETGWDWFRFYINGAAELERNGVIPYSTVTFNLNPGTHTLRWEYSKDGSFSSGSDQVFIDDILITEIGDPAIRIADGTEAVNRILKSDANGYGTWQDAASGFTDLDWIFNSGSTNTDPIYHVGPVLINQSSYLAAQSDFYVNNGLIIGTQVGFGSIEYIIDDLNATLFSDTISPLTDNSMNLGDATYRWNTLFSTNGYTTTSDRRVKTDIKPLQYGINDLLLLNPVSYKWKDRVNKSKQNLKQAILKKGELVKPLNDETIIGFIAQDLNKVIPEVVHTYEWKKDKKGNPIKIPMKTLGVSYSDLIPVLIKSIQDQQKILEKIDSDQKEISKKINLK